MGAARRAGLQKVYGVAAADTKAREVVGVLKGVRGFD
jgi:hypothetical protein